MRILLTLPFVLLPALAQAQTTRQAIPDTVLKQDYERCVATCDQSRSYAFCADRCGCAAEQMSRHWSLDQYGTRAAALRTNSRDAAVSAELTRLASYCANRR